MNSNYSTTQLYTKEKPIVKLGSNKEHPNQLFSSNNETRKGEGGLRKKGIFKKSLENKPLISIVTIVYNGEAYLEQTIQHVLNQNYDNIEYIIIDGGSTDDSLSIIKKYEEQIDYWVSEKDKGIYDAFNKGISLTTGKYVGLINADDYYDLNAVKVIADESLKFPEVDVFYANMYLHNDKHKRKKIMKALSLDNLDRDICVNHPTCFVRKEIYNSIQFNLEYQLSADYEFIIKLFKNNYKFKYIDKVMANMRDGGVSTAFNKAEKESYTIRKKYFGRYKANKVFASKLVKKWMKSTILLFVSESNWVNKRYSD